MGGRESFFSLRLGSSLSLSLSLSLLLYLFVSNDEAKATQCPQRDNGKVYEEEPPPFPRKSCRKKERKNAFF